MNYPHTVTVGETFSGVKVEITISASDLPGVSPTGTTGKEIADRYGYKGKAIRERLAKQIEHLFAVVELAAVDAHMAHKKEIRQMEVADRDAAIQAAKDETANKFVTDLQAHKEQDAAAFAKAQAGFENSLAMIEKNLCSEVNRLKAALAAAKATKRSNAAKAGHMRKASKAGRK